MELIQNIFLKQMKTPKSLRRASLISSKYLNRWEEKISLNLGQKYQAFCERVKAYGQRICV